MIKDLDSRSRGNDHYLFFIYAKVLKRAIRGGLVEPKAIMRL